MRSLNFIVLFCIMICSCEKANTQPNISKKELKRKQDKIQEQILDARKKLHGNKKSNLQFDSALNVVAGVLNSDTLQIVKKQDKEELLRILRDYGIYDYKVGIIEKELPKLDRKTIREINKQKNIRSFLSDTAYNLGGLHLKQKNGKYKLQIVYSKHLVKISLEKCMKTSTIMAGGVVYDSLHIVGKSTINPIYYKHLSNFPSKKTIPISESKKAIINKNGEFKLDIPFTHPRSQFSNYSKYKKYVAITNKKGNIISLY